MATAIYRKPKNLIERAQQECMMRDDEIIPSRLVATVINYTGSVIDAYNLNWSPSMKAYAKEFIDKYYWKRLLYEFFGGKKPMKRIRLV